MKLLRIATAAAVLSSGCAGSGSGSSADRAAVAALDHPHEGNHEHGHDHRVSEHHRHHHHEDHDRWVQEDDEADTMIGDLIAALLETVIDQLLGNGGSGD